MKNLDTTLWIYTFFSFMLLFSLKAQLWGMGPFWVVGVVSVFNLGLFGSGVRLEAHHRGGGLSNVQKSGKQFLAS